MAGVSDTEAMIAGMDPALGTTDYVFCTAPPGERVEAALSHAIAVFREEEGVSLVLPATAAARLGFPASPPMRCITLTVRSSLEGVGLTAAVAGALASAGIACNVIAAFHHDHLFVPARDAGRALAALARLQDEARRPAG